MKLLDEYMAVFPKPLMAAFGLGGQPVRITACSSPPTSGACSGRSSPRWPGRSSERRAVAADLDRGFLELPLATRIDRVRYLAAAIVGQVGVIAVLSVAVMAGILLVGAVVGAGFDAGRFLLEVPLLFLFGCARDRVRDAAVGDHAEPRRQRGRRRRHAAGHVPVSTRCRSSRRASTGWARSAPSGTCARPRRSIRASCPSARWLSSAIVAVAMWSIAVWVFRTRDLA